MIDNLPKNINLIYFGHINHNIGEINNHKNVLFFQQNLNDIAMEAYSCFKTTKQHHLMPKIMVAYTKSGCLYISLANFYQMIGSCLIKLGKLLNLT